MALRALRRAPPSLMRFDALGRCCALCKSPTVLHSASRRLSSVSPPHYTWDDPETAARDALLQFIDPYEKDPDMGEPGRRWRAAEIRLKSDEDLQKLWVVLLKERNMLHTAKLYHRSNKTEMPHMARIPAVRKSMAMIKVVLGERQRASAERARRLTEEHVRDRALEQLDMTASELWPPWIPGAPRELQVAAAHTFSVILRTRDGAPPRVTPPADALAFAFSYEGEPIDEALAPMRVHVRPPVPSRPGEIAYSCHLQMSGRAIPSSHWVRSQDGQANPLTVHLEGSLYGEPLGGGAVEVRLSPSKRWRRAAAMAAINAEMAATLRARAEAAKAEQTEPET